MSTPEQPALLNPPKPPINKKEVFADVVAFLSIVNSYFFVSLTLHFSIFEGQLALDLNNPTTIVILYLSYSLFILTIKAIASLIGVVKRTEGENQLTKWINDQVSFSLLTVLLVTSLYVFVHHSVRSFTVEEFCHVAVWLWIAEISKIIGALFGRLSGVSSFDYFGRSIGVILVIGGLLEPLGVGVFSTF